MHIDKQTLFDLDIFKTEEGHSTVFGLVNKTKTTGGKFRLREMFSNPPEGIHAVMEKQMAIRHLYHNLDYYKLPISDRQMKSVESYLVTNINPVKSNSFFESLEFRLTDIQSYKYLKTCIPDVISFVKGFYKLFLQQQQNLPYILQAPFNELVNIINDEDFKRITSTWGKYAKFQKVLEADRIFRGKLKMSITNLVKWYFEFDALMAMAISSHENHFVFPEFIENDETLFLGEGIYHPILNNPVPYDVKLDKISNFIFLTGPNMSGKTTFLKTIGIVVYLAHLGMGVPATLVKINYFDRLFSSINISDDILNGQSFFYNEVKRVKQLAQSISIHERIFSLSDELFRGTNVKDAYDATILIISGLAGWNNNIFIISSHLWEIWEKIEHHKNIKPLYFESYVKNGAPYFTYRLLPGVSNLRMGLTIIDNEKIMGLLKP